MRMELAAEAGRRRAPIEHSADSRAFVNELLGDLRDERWSPSGWARFLGRSVARSWADAAQRPCTVAELTAVHLALFVMRPGPWPAATWAMAATHLGLLDEGADRLGVANRLTLLRANLPALAGAHSAATAPVALATDWLDGRLARRSRPTAFGAYADATADIAFWTWYVHRHETNRLLRWTAETLWVGPAALITVGYFARGRTLDYPRPFAFRTLSVAAQGLVTLRALQRAQRDRRHGQVTSPTSPMFRTPTLRVPTPKRRRCDA